LPRSTKPTSKASIGVRADGVYLPDSNRTRDLLKNRPANKRDQTMPRGGRRSTSFKPGVSGNPSGRPRRPDTIAARQIFVTVKTAARALTQEAIDTLAAVMRDGRAPPTARISAAVALLDRGHGRPPQAVELNVGYDLARLTDDELETLELIMERATLPSSN
jgi:hypothetical protein